MNLCFYKRNQSGKHLQVTFYIFSNQNCILTEKIYFVFWKLKSNKFICICVLIAKIQQIDLNFGFGVKNQTNWFEFVFWQKKSIWSTFTGYFLYFLKSNLLFDRKNPENWFQFVFWQVKSNELVWICVLTGNATKFISICVLKQKFKQFGCNRGCWILN